MLKKKRPPKIKSHTKSKIMIQKKIFKNLINNYNILPRKVTDILFKVQVQKEHLIYYHEK
jgi:hypothetical protein